MIKYSKYSENKVFLPFVIVTTLVLSIMFTSIKSGLWEMNKKIIVVSVIIWIAWLFLFLRDKVKGAKIADNNGLLLVKLLFAVIISLFFANTVWFSGYLTLNTINAISQGNIHVDTLFHSTIAESFKNYGYSSVLINEAGGNLLRYHFGSHFLMALVSFTFNISAFDAYNYLYPTICIPIYVYLIISVIIEIRKYKRETVRLSIVDYIFLSFFFIGFIP